MSDIDLVVRGGTIIDGTGGEPYEADIALSGNRIVQIGRVPAPGADEIDVRGKIVTPGFIDVHTHYDARSRGRTTSRRPPGTA
jgi:N-acyl-D-aspartate/D-glutamate deacylase